MLRRVPETSLDFSFTLTASEDEWHLALNGSGDKSPSWAIESELVSPLEVLDWTMALLGQWVVSTVLLKSIIFCSQGLSKRLVVSCLSKREDKLIFLMDRNRVDMCTEFLLSCAPQIGIDSNLYR